MANIVSDRLLKIVGKLFLIISLVGVEIIFRIRDYTDKSIDFQIYLKFGIFVGMILYSGVSVIRKNEHYAARNAESVATFIFLMLLLASCIYSNNIVYAFASCFTIIATFSFFNAISRYGSAWLIENCLKGSLLFLMVSFLYFVALPELGRLSYWENGYFIEGGRMSGAASSPNAMGLFSCFSSIVAANSIGNRRNKFLSIAVLSISFVALVLSGNRFSLAIGIVLSAYAAYRREWKILYSIAFAAAPLLLFASFVMIGATGLSRSGGMEELYTLTGRTYIWEASLDLINKSPFIGYGYGSVVTLFIPYYDVLGFIPSSAHNMFLQAALTIGWVGGIFCFFVVSLLLVKSRKNKFSLSLVLFVLFTGLLEPGAFSGTASISTFAFFIALSNLQTLRKSNL